MRFQLLGTLEIQDGPRRITPSAPKQRSVLALLLSSANEVTPTEVLMGELWEGRPPTSAQTTLQTYVYQLRKLLSQGTGPEDSPRLVTKHGGYLLTIARDALDAIEFEGLVDVARESLHAGDVERASKAVRHALDLWHGPALADVVTGPRLDIYRTRLEELRVHAIKLKIETQMKMGQHHELIGELKELTTVYALDEWFHLQLMEALSRAGRRHEALEVYHRLRYLLREELGLEPGFEMQELQQAVLATSAPRSARPRHVARTAIRP
ncbi:AfsR/SARP family transcriptional regulator [Streptosporangium sp. H16]|uniref:AfsR/SARP family transcriptional regulator n=1 Tax=Streptosporangium sp. H16 TaxID=3444184 RepID=UPI003F7AEE87